MNKQWDRLVFAVAAGALIAIATSIAQGDQKPSQRPKPPQAPPAREEKAPEWRYLMTRTLTPHDYHDWIAEECPADAEWRIVPASTPLILKATKRQNSNGLPVWRLEIWNPSDGYVEDFKVEFRERRMLKSEPRGASGAPGVLPAPLASFVDVRPGVPLFFSSPRRGGGC